MIERDETQLGDRLVYHDGGVICKVIDVDHYCLVVEDEEDGIVVEIPPDDYDRYSKLPDSVQG